MTPRPDATELDLRALRTAVERTLARFLEDKARGPLGPHIAKLIPVLHHFLDGGGKRVRPLYCCLGWHTLDDAPPTDDVLRAAAGIELFHTFALIQDDVMDRADTRHGRPTAHRLLAAQGPRSRAPWFGESVAILLGDLCEAWSAELLGGLGHPIARRPVDLMRSETIVGQYLDLCASGRDPGSVNSAFTVIHYKTTKYTVERPLQIGAALAGAEPALMDTYAAYAQPLGEAFQVYNDLEDVLPDSTKPDTGGSDLREGKHTVVLALALRSANVAQAELLDHLVGDPHLDAIELAQVRALIAATGAVDQAKRLVLERRRQALRVLEAAPFRPAAKRALDRLTAIAMPRAARWEAELDLG
ncbi:polyprenyl synthetase family protein [Chondromyces crocatus]|uniref:Geranylgeranyl pyrophosphate synthase n=1 Tax=Chondromyces crocatus TaxID=52 RepID=A0A0K1EB75_CHOCO|nr:polyprenyl synthetase family protein [Chondromyces crocatus]AKT37833.1 geranylgeranyl pyrophosphate synthase [Chondromyces crocatus]